MSLRKSICTISLIKCDITAIKADILVTSSNENLMGNKNGSYWRFNGRINVDGSIRSSLNQKELDEDLKDKILKPGESIITPSSGLIKENNIKYIIHTCVPDGAYGFDSTNSIEVFRNCFSSCLTLAESKQASSLAFPALGCGVKEWNKGRASDIAFTSICEQASKLRSLHQIFFVFKEASVFNTFKLVGEKKLGLGYEEIDKYSFKVHNI